MYTTYTRIVGNPHFVAAKTPPLLEIASPSSSWQRHRVAPAGPCATLLGWLLAWAGPRLGIAISAIGKIVI